MRLRLSKIRYLRDTISHDWDYFQEFRDFIIRNIKSESVIIRNMAERAKQELSPEDFELYSEDLAGEHHLITHSFAQMACRSMIVMIWAASERAFNRLCDVVQKERSLALNLSDMAGRGLDRHRRYITKVLGIDLTHENQLWTEIRSLNNIRNCIVHHANRPNDKIVNHSTWREIWEEIGDEYLDQDTIEARFIGAIKKPYDEYYGSQKLSFNHFGKSPGEMLFSVEFINLALKNTLNFINNTMDLIIQELRLQ